MPCVSWACSPSYRMAEGEGSNTPGTIREMLLWLHGLTQNGHKTKLEQYIDTELTQKFTSPPTVSTAISRVTNEAKTLIETVCSGAGKILKSIQKGQKEATVNNGTFSSEISNLNYPSDGKKLYDLFLYYITCCCWQLRFLYLRCNTWSAVGGWGSCQYGNGTQEESDKCQNGQHNGNDRCQTCSKSSGCLQTFFTHGSKGDQQSTDSQKKNIYNGANNSGQCPDGTKQPQTSSTQCPIPPMGFDKNKNLPAGSKSAKDLKDILDSYFNGQDNSKSFPKLLGHLLALELLQVNGSASQSSSSTALQVPSSWGLPHLFAFWAAFSTKWNNKSNGEQFKDAWQKKFNEELNANGQAGGTEYKWTPENPDTLLEALFKEHKDGNSSQHSNNTSSHNSLLTLTSCEVKTNGSGTHCGKYLHGLLELPFEHVVGEFKDNGLFGHFMTSDTIKNFAKKFHDTFKDFKEKLQNQTCVTGNNCQCIVWCDLTHSCMYQNGLTFNSPLSLAVKKSKGTDGVEADSSRTGAQERKCSDLSQQLEHVLQNDAPLWKLAQLKKESVASSPAGAASPASSAGTRLTASVMRVVDKEDEAKKEINDTLCSIKTDTVRNDVFASLGEALDFNDCSVSPEPTPAPQAQTQQQTQSQALTQSQPPPVGDKGANASSTGTVKITDNNRDVLGNWIKAFGDVLTELVKVTKKATALASASAARTSVLILREINAHHSSLLEPPCNIKECIDWLIRVGELDKKGWTENNNKRVPFNNNGLCIRYCIAHVSAGPLHRNSMALQEAIKKLTGSQRTYDSGIKELIERLSDFIGYQDGEILGAANSSHGIATASYYSAYSLSAQWPTCGPATGGTNCGVQCSCSKDNKCNCTASPCNGQCCNQCDVRVCAGIFIAMVPALEKALRELKERCDQKLKDNKAKNTQTINDLKDIFEPFGFKDKDLSTTQWRQGHGPRTNLKSAITELNKIKESIKNALEDKENRPDRNGFEAPLESVPCATTASCSTTPARAKDCNVSHTTCSTPRTIREMLLWLMGLPYCEGYQQFVEKLKEKSQQEPFNTMLSSTVKSSRKDNNNDHYLHRQYSAVIFHLPVLFFTVEGTVSYLRDTFCQFTGDNKNCRTDNTHCKTGTDKNCTTGTDKKNCTVLRFHYERCGRCLLRTFCACVAVLYPVQRFLIKRCYSSVRTPRGRTATRTVNPSTKEDCCSPCPTALNDWSQLCVKGPSKDCKHGTECKDSSCCKDNKGSTACNTSTLTVFRSACQCRALYEFVRFMGFRVGAKVALTGTALQVVLRDCFGDQDEEAMESGSNSRTVNVRSSTKKNPYVKLASCWRLSRCVLRGHCQKGESSPVCCDECHVACSSKCSAQCCAPCVQDNALPSSSCSPSTIRQMMLWLIGLPLTEAYKKDQDTVPTGGASRPTASSGYLFGTDGCVSNGVQCIPELKKLEENNNTHTRQRVPKEKPVKDTISYDRLFKSYYKETIVWMLVVFNAIEGSLTSVLCYLRDHAPGTGASRGGPDCTVGQKEASSSHVCSQFTYEFRDPSKLLGTFCRYIYKVHFQLRFLLTMCSTPKGDGGWSQCIYSNKGFATVTGGVCRCLKDMNIPCNNSPLRHFLNSTDEKNKFKLCDGEKEHSSMGFTVRTCSSSLTGANIATVLEDLIDPIDTSFSPPTFTRPLSLLTQYCVAIGPVEPSSLGDIFSVFRELGVSSMWMTMSLYGQEGETFSRTLSKELWSVFKCCNEGCIKECKKETHTCSEDCKDSNRDCARRYSRELKESISNVMARHKDSKAPNDPCNYSHRYSLSSLMCSGTTNTGASSPEASSSSTESPVSPQCASPCAPYLKSLSQGLYTYYCPRVPGAGDSKSFGVLQWLYDRLRQLLDKMKELKGAFEKCHKGNNYNGSSSSSCQSLCSDIVSCPYAHPTIYSFGFVLGEPEALKWSNNDKNCNKGEHKDKKNCASFLQQLGCVLRVPEGCQKGCCKKERGVLCCQRSSVPSQDASQASPIPPVSALYLAFECVITIVYRIMLKKALLRVQCTVEQWYKDCEEQQQNASQNDNENALQCQLIEAFSLYVQNAMYDSYPALICTFACQVFEKNYNKITSSVCDVSNVSRVSSVSHASQLHHCPCVHRAPGGAPTRRITTAMCHNRDCHCSKLKDGVQCSTALDSKAEQCSNASLCISKSSVTSITAVIPQYCPRAIDRYHYRAFQKKSDTESKEKTSGTSSCATYDFESALDFHIKAANCILPVPSNLRSAVDWLLRVSRGAPAMGALATKEKDNNCAVVCQERNNCTVSQRGDLCCDPEVQMFQCLAEEISCVLNGDKKQCDTLSTVSQCQECNALSIVYQCQDCNVSSTVPNTSTVSSSCAQCLLRSLAQGLRTFVGYKDMTQEVKGEVLKERNSVQKEIHCLLECLRAFMCNKGAVSTAASSKCSLLAELGNALLKAEFGLKETDVVETLIDITATITDVILGAEGQKKMFSRKYFSDVLCMFTTALTSDHKDCHSDLRCNTMKDCKKHCANVCKDTCVTISKHTCVTTTANTSKGFPQGLSQLCDFFQGIQRFACEWNDIGRQGSASTGSPKKGEQLLCCSQNPCQPCQSSSSCSSVCPFPPSSDVVFNERQKAECLGWTFNGKEEKCTRKENCPQDCSTSLSSSSSSSPSCPRGFFQQLQCGLHVLGQCAERVSELCNVSSSVPSGTTGGTEQCNTETKNNDSQCHITQYRQKLCELIEALKKFGEHIEGCKFGGAPQACATTCNVSCQKGALKPAPSVKCSASPCSCRADPSYAVDGAKKLMEQTKRGVEQYITVKFIEKIGAAVGMSTHENMLHINSLLGFNNKFTEIVLRTYKSHLDDLKRLCQWLYRMAQLYAHGLKGFVESLVSHLEHVIQVIDWITGIERMIRGFGDKDCVSKARELIDRSVFECIPQCCQRHKGSVTNALCDPCTSGTVTDSSSSSTATNTCVVSPSVFFDALNCRIDNLLSSYVLGPLPRGTITQNDSACSQGESPSAPGATPSASDRSCHFRAFLERLRLLAIDRYTLQLWQDESCPTNRVSSIRHWNVFEGGIVRHSNLEGIKRGLCGLTQMEGYKGVQECGVLCSSDGQKDSSVQCFNVSSTAPPSGTISFTLSPSHRIHDFHAICVIQKFSFEAPLRALQCSIQGLEQIKEALQKCEQGLQPLQELLRECDCHCRGVTSCDDQCQASCKKECCKDILKDCCRNMLSASSSGSSTAAPFCELYRSLCDFLNGPYGVFNFAKFLHTILGPNAFSAVICSLRDLRDVLCQLMQKGIISESEKVLQDCKVSLPSNKDSCSPSCAAVPSNKDSCCLCRLMRRMCAIVSTLNGRNHLRTLKDTVSTVTTAQCNGNDDCYSLDSVTKRLEAFVDVLRREYIFSYPVVCGIESDKDCNAVCPGECDTECCEKSKDTSLACSSQSSVTDRHASPSATSTVSLTSLPLLRAHCHLSSSICPCCVPILARIFITLVPVLYPQLCYLAYQCRLYWQQDHMNGYKDSALRSLLNTFGWPTECLSNYYIAIDVHIHGRFVSWLLCNEDNSLQLLRDNMSEPSNVLPFNTESPFYRLYTLCVSYYQRRKNERFTDSKSTPPLMPTSVREILRFFVYLPFSAQFDDVKCTMQRYCNQSCVVHFSDIFTTLMMSSAMSAVLLQLIECPQGAFLRFFDDIYTNTEGLYLDFNTETLFYQLCDLSVTLYRGLKFLSLQCGTGASLAGWKDCRLRGVKGNKERDDTGALDSECRHLCECQSIGAKDSSTTCSVLTTAVPMCLNSGPSASTSATQSSTLASHTTSCPLPLLRYMTDDRFFDSTLTVPSALRKVCLNDSCQEMIYRNMAPRGWEKEMLQCAHKEGQKGNSQLEVCDQKACYSVCHARDCDRKSCDRSKCHPCSGTQCSRVMCSTLYGHHLFHLLGNFVGHEHDADPLLQFTRYMVSIAAWPPDSLSGYMTFMLRFSDQLRKEGNDVSGSVTHGKTSQKKDWNSSLLSSLHSEISLFPGEFDHKCLIDAFLRVTHCEHNNGVASSSSAASLPSSTTDASSSPLCPTSTGTTISVLRDCKDCNYYNCIIYPLDYEVYDLYLPMYARRYLTWMVHFGPRLHRGMRALEKGFKRHIEENGSQSGQSGACSTDHSVTQSGTMQSHTSVPCHPSMLQCPFALPELHSAGLHFWDPEKMCTVSCQCLLQRLRCTLQDSSPLAEFLSACDRFLWSVRKPFYWLTMTLWIVATVYLLFVHLWRLDSWRLLSHAIRSRASHVVYPKVLLSAEPEHYDYAGL